MKILPRAYLRTRKYPLSLESRPDSEKFASSEICALHVAVLAVFCFVRVESKRKEFEFRSVFQPAFHNMQRPITGWFLKMRCRTRGVRTRLSGILLKVDLR